MRDPNARLYTGIINLWHARYDTAEIAALVDQPEHIVSNWIATYRDTSRSKASA